MWAPTEKKEKKRSLADLWPKAWSVMAVVGGGVSYTRTWSWFYVRRIHKWLYTSELNHTHHTDVRAQELCESRDGRRELPVPNKPTVSVDVKQHSTIKLTWYPCLCCCVPCYIYRLHWLTAVSSLVGWFFFLPTCDFRFKFESMFAVCESEAFFLGL